MTATDISASANAKANANDTASDTAPRRAINRRALRRALIAAGAVAALGAVVLAWQGYRAVGTEWLLGAVGLCG